MSTLINAFLVHIAHKHLCNNQFMIFFLRFLHKTQKNYEIQKKHKRFLLYDEGATCCQPYFTFNGFNCEENFLTTHKKCVFMLRKWSEI